MQTAPKSIGRAKTVLVGGDGVHAVITSVVVRATESDGSPRVRFLGPGVFGESAAQYITYVVVPIVDHMLEGLRVPRKSFQISLVNLGATATADIGLRVSGFSADVPAFLALLSAGLAMPLPQDMVATGHVASTDGDIASVRAIPAKLAAALADSTIRRFVYPATAGDGSLPAFSPAVLRQLEDAVVAARDRLRISAVGNVAELVETVFDDEAIVEAGLRAGFFSVSELPSATDAVGRAAAHLATANDARFWLVLERRLLAGEGPSAKRLLHDRTAFQTDHRTYPTAFGRRLLNLVQSLPPNIRRLKSIFPLLSTRDCIALSQFASDADHEDVRLLYDAASGKRTTWVPKTADQGRSTCATADATSAKTLDVVLAEIAPAYLAASIGLPIDAARAGYTLDAVTVDSSEEFNELVAGFYLHLLRHTRSVPASVEVGAVAREALDVLEQAFLPHGGYKAALAEARVGSRGGMRFVLDMMTERTKSEEQVKHVNMVFKSALDALDWEAKVAFMAALLERLGPHLPPEIRSESPEHFAVHLEAIVRAYVQSLESVKALLRAL